MAAASADDAPVMSTEERGPTVAPLLGSQPAASAIDRSAGGSETALAAREFPFGEIPSLCILEIRLVRGSPS